MFLLFLACHAPIDPVRGDTFYASDDAPVSLDAVPAGVRTGPVRGARFLACGAATRAELVFEQGRLVETRTTPRCACVEENAAVLEWDGLDLGGVPLAHTAHAVLVYDVPAIVAGGEIATRPPA